jgi:L-rhamnose-H+ transport protein
MGDYTNKDTPIRANIMFAGIAGIIWAMQFVFQKVGEPAMGKDLAYISFAIVMGSAIFFSSLVGVMTGEWKGTAALFLYHLFWKQDEVEWECNACKSGCRSSG